MCLPLPSFLLRRIPFAPQISALEEQIKEKNSKIEELRIEIVKVSVVVLEFFASSSLRLIFPLLPPLFLPYFYQTQSLQTAHEAQKDSNRAATDERTAVLAELRARVSAQKQFPSSLSRLTFSRTSFSTFLPKIQVLEAEKAALVVSANQARSIGGSSTVRFFARSLLVARV